MAGIKWSSVEDEFLRNNYATLNSRKLAEMWEEIFGLKRTAKAISVRALTKHKGIKINRGKFDYYKCLNCGKEFKRVAKYITLNVRFCCPRCANEYKKLQYRKNLHLTNAMYDKVLRRDLNYIEAYFKNHSNENRVPYDDLIDYFFNNQCPYYVALCIRLNRRISLRNFFKYALLIYYRSLKRRNNLYKNIENKLKVENSFLEIGQQSY